MQKRVFQKASDHTRTGSPRVLLLQGPVGPFFKHLRAHLEKVGYKCSRVIFNPADWFYAGSGENIRFSGGLWEWHSWLRAALLQKKFDAIVGFGCFRPVHKVAREVAAETRTPYLSLEEGYLRSGFVTVDFQGNNAASPLAGRLPPPEFELDGSFSVPLKNFRSFGDMCRHGTLYYTLNTILSQPEQRRLFHRPLNLWKESFCWSRNVVRYLHKRSADFRVIEQLLEHSDRRYFLVPLQVATDSQMGPPALGWTTPRLIDEVLASFARSSPPECRLVFKLHPLERGHSNARKYVGAVADGLGIAEKVDVLDTGSLGC